jgi:hypothetical protein
LGFFPILDQPTRPIILLQLQADFFAGKQNSITLPRFSGGIHFPGFENFVGL